MYKIIILLALIAGTPLAFAHHPQYEQTQCAASYNSETDGSWKWCYDFDHDDIPDEIDKCPDDWAPRQFYKDGCSQIHMEPSYTEYEGPDWILILVEWNEQKIIDDHTYDIALTWLFNHNILKIKQ